MSPKRFLVFTLILAAQPVAAATTVSFGNQSEQCLLATFLAGNLEQPAEIVSCGVGDGGSVSVLGCGAASCDLTASNAVDSSWSPPGNGYVQSGLGYFETAGPGDSKGICFDAGDQPVGSSASCSGTSEPLAVPVAAGQCHEFFVLSGLVLDPIFVPPPVYALLYFWSRVDHQFTVCRDATGDPSLQHIGDTIY